jgi:nucleoside-diphosphate-sugar epimerase
LGALDRLWFFCSICLGGREELVVATKIALSGANGFVGRAVLARLIQENYSVIAFVRDQGARQLEETNIPVISLIDRTSWRAALRQCSVFIHCAGRAHITKGHKRDSLPKFREVNTNLTLALARSAAAAGVKRFVFVSSIGVNGLSSGQEPFTPERGPNLQTPYAISKYEAEQGLQAIAQETGLEVVVVRPPLVYGAGAPGNFGALLAIIGRGWPLPFGALTENRRSYVALPNLVDFLLMVCHHPAAANQVFLISDGEDLSTADLLCRLGIAIGRPVRLWSVSPAMLRLGAMMLCRQDLAQRLMADLRVDITKATRLLGWSPLVSVQEGLNLAVRGA